MVSDADPLQLSPTEFEELVRDTLADGVVVEPDFDAALTGVQRGAATVVVTGSFHTVGDAMARLPGFTTLR